MKVCVINDLELPEKIESCDIVILLKNPIPISFQHSPIESEMWLVRYFSNWINNLPCSNCIGCYFQFSQYIHDRICTNTKLKFEIIQNSEFNIISENQVVKFWIGEDFDKIPKNCDIVIVNDIPDERTITQTRKKTDGNVELAKIIKDRQPRITVFTGKTTSKLESKKNCITKFASVADILYFDYD